MKGKLNKTEKRLEVVNKMIVEQAWASDGINEDFYDLENEMEDNFMQIESATEDIMVDAERLKTGNSSFSSCDDAVDTITSVFNDMADRVSEFDLARRAMEREQEKMAALVKEQRMLKKRLKAAKARRTK